MKLAKSIELALGLAVGSSMALVLSSSAFAADSSTGTTASVSEVSQQVDSTVGSKDKVNTKADTQATTVTVSTSQTSASNTSSTTLPESSKSVTPSSAVQSDNTPVKVVNPATSSAESVAPKLVSDTQATAILQTELVKIPDVTSGAPLATTSTTTSPISSGVGVTYHTSRLEIQPKITNNHLALEADLAAMVPTAVSQRDKNGNTPAPSQPGNVLGRLTAVLAGSVVPSAFFAQIVAVVGLSIELCLLVVVSLLFARRIVGLYAAPNRDGFAHAPRSDVPQYAMFNSFATPLKLSYVSAFTP